MSYVALIVRSLFVLILFASPALAASITIVPTGNPAAFSVLGTDMDSVAGIQLDIAYDEASLATPTVTQGGLVTRAMLAANTTRPGVIRIAIISAGGAFFGNGQIAAITFASKSASAPLPSLTYSMIDSKGAAITTSSSIVDDTVNPGTALSPGAPYSQTSQPEAQQPNTSTSASGTAPATPTYPGTVMLPTEQQPSDARPAPPPPSPDYTGEPPATTIAEQAQPPERAAADIKTEKTPQLVVYKGILDRFKQYNGSKDFSAIVTFFKKNVAQTFNQNPALVLSDGKSKATLTIDIPVKIDLSPNFAVNGGKLAAFKQVKQSKDRWIVEVLPEVGSTMVTVTIMAGVDEFVFSLAVAPPIKTALPLDEQGWNRFLKEVGANRNPLHDFNNDGVRDYMDEYIFVVNYLLTKSTADKPAAVKEPKKQIIK